MASTLLDNRWLLGTAFLVADQLRQFRNDPPQVFFPRVYAQPTKTNEALCSLLSAVVLRTLRRTYVHRAPNPSRPVYCRNTTQEAGATGVTWHDAARTATAGQAHRRPSVTTRTLMFSTPVLIVLTNANTTDRIEQLMEAAISKGWLVAEPDLSTLSARHNALTRMVNCIQPQVPIYVYADVGCCSHLQPCLEVMTGDETRIHGVVAVSSTIAERQQCHSSYPTAVPTLVLACWEQQDDDDGQNMLAAAECCRNPAVIVVHVVPKVDRRIGNIDHSALPRHSYQTWMARCAVTFMEATTWLREQGKRGDVVSRL